MIPETSKVCMEFWKLSSEIDAFMKDWMVFHILIAGGKHCAYYRLNFVLPYLQDSGTEFFRLCSTFPHCWKLGTTLLRGDSEAPHEDLVCRKRQLKKIGLE
jgi:hypothetical protein